MSLVVASRGFTMLDSDSTDGRGSSVSPMKSRVTSLSDKSRERTDSGASSVEKNRYSSVSSAGASLPAHEAGGCYVCLFNIIFVFFFSIQRSLLPSIKQQS